MFCNSRVIALTTYRESVRSKIMYSFFAFAIFIIVLSSIFSATTVGDQIKLIKDFGLFTISIFSVGFVVVAGSSLLAKELAKKTVFNILAKPVRRWEFLFGKYLGMLMTGSMMVVLMSLGLTVYLWLMEGRFDSSLLQAYLYILLELVIICASAIFFSSIVVTPMLSGIFTFGMFLTGRSVVYLLQFSQDQEMPLVLRSISGVLYWIFPHLNQLYIGNDVIYGFSANFSDVLTSIVYATGYACALLALSNLIFIKREFN